MTTYVKLKEKILMILCRFFENGVERASEGPLTFQAIRRNRQVIPSFQVQFSSGRGTPAYYNAIIRGLIYHRPPDCYKIICEAYATGRRTRSRNISLSNQTSHVNKCTDPATELQWLVEITDKLVLMYDN